ncbi:transketolase [Pectobacterium aroidearum]|uniref:Transketolase n=1 Tax=Pectobacterium aroidearum TaxID=1201031 RepID=A0AAW3SSV1_9GAMM|nr:MULTISPECIES: transketolase C-terminal domain-containing protein [Pectobacterium]MBA5198793.1 transketolase [Pectobacterium aroidearum]MBA5203160.1 transketolase [Pectobacterium aroidearum]MBA5226704.1 transketolase [Pectobacterium aroidearum]MBA5231585.1 transketolase [Pectobacterium aroidearum]MBA5736730.1 transketolase [Pectobacterium aroidearum]
MLVIKPTSIRSWSMLGSRGTFGLTLLDLAQQDENIVALSADLGKSSGLDRFSAAYPDRFFNAGIAEQNMVGMAAGLAAGGYVPFVTSFANFLTMRAGEQVRHNLGYMHENVKLVGLASGVATGMFGATHHGIEDIAALRSISNITILSPADCTETVKMTEAALKHSGPVYLRLTGNMRAPIVYKDDYELEIGRAISLREGEDVCIVATGSMVFYALEAAALLAESNIDCTVIDMHTIKPLDTMILDRQLDKRLIVTIEEHSVIGGLGSSVAEHLAAKWQKPPQLILGIPQGYPDAGDYSYLLEQCGLTTNSIAHSIQRFMDSGSHVS